MAESAFSRWLRNELERRDLGVAEAAVAIGVSHSMVSRYQNGAGDPGRKSLRKIAVWAERPVAELEAMLHEGQPAQAARGAREAPAVYRGAPTAADVARELLAQGLGAEVAAQLRAGWPQGFAHHRSPVRPLHHDDDPAAG